jgi:Fic family protein
MIEIGQLDLQQMRILAIVSRTGKLTTSALLSELNQSGDHAISQITLTRKVKPLLDLEYLERIGKARAVHYKVSQKGLLFAPIDPDSYFEINQEKRWIQERFNFDLFNDLKKYPIFSTPEMQFLISLEKEFQEQKAELSSTLLKKEFERLTIELSWKSSAIEGNTYSLLETETLLKEGIEAKGKKAEEVRMLLNHKAAFDFLRDHSLQDYPISISYIEMIHSLLIENLGVSKNLRKNLVGITGTRYRPLDNQFQIREALENACLLINSLPDCFTRAFLAILFISYIQPFEDGNKRCARLIGNALLLANDSCPLSFRSVDETEYKKAILLFYEQNNISAFKKIFLEQYEFAVTNYFRSKN